VKRTTPAPKGEIDLGCDHFVRFMVWQPDLSIELNRAKWGHLAERFNDIDNVVGCIVRHKCNTETGWHEGGIHFDTEFVRESGVNWGATWQVRSWDPLHLEPSLQSHCPCNDHGFIRGGRWERA
jgi:hypothetical protein